LPAIIWSRIFSLPVRDINVWWLRHKELKFCLFCCGTITVHTKKKPLLLLQGWLSIMYQILANGRTLKEGFMASCHTISTAQYGEQPKGTKKHTQLLQYLHTKEPSPLKASDCRSCWFDTELLHGIYRHNGSKCIEEKDAIQKYLSTDRKLEI